VISLEFDIKPTEKSIEVMTSREHRAEAASLQALLNARSVAVLGASTRPEAVGNVVVRNILAGGYTGQLYPIHPDASDVCGMRSYAHIGEIGQPVDLAIISLPVEAVLRAAAECGDAGVRGLVVITDGFADLDGEGEDREALLTKICRVGGMRLLGPASLGLVNTDPAVRLNGSVMPVPVRDGGLGMFSQSGGLGLVMLAEAAERGLTVSSFVSAGNRADVSGNDLLQFWEEDPRTKVVAMYTESSGNPRKFFRIARHVTRTKPVVLVRSWVGGAASAPLPGRLSQAPREAFDALMRQAGVVRVDDIRHLMDVAQVLADQPLPRGHRVAILANSPVVASLVEEACVSRELSVNRRPTAWWWRWYHRWRGSTRRCSTFSGPASPTGRCPPSRVWWPTRCWVNRSRSTGCPPTTPPKTRCARWLRPATTGSGSAATTGCWSTRRAPNRRPPATSSNARWPRPSTRPAPDSARSRHETCSPATAFT
jgi:succinyl-CoA synthetase alpha subunit